MVWGYATHIAGNDPLTPAEIARVVSLSGGAFIANAVSVTMLVAETMMQRR
jgi:hypothetical protein